VVHDLVGDAALTERIREQLRLAGVAAGLRVGQRRLLGPITPVFATPGTEYCALTATAPNGGVMGVRSRALSESSRYCGV